MSLSGIRKRPNNDVATDQTLGLWCRPRPWRRVAVWAATPTPADASNSKFWEGEKKKREQKDFPGTGGDGFLGMALSKYLLFFLFDVRFAQEWRMSIFPQHAPAGCGPRREESGCRRSQSPEPSEICLNIALEIKGPTTAGSPAPRRLAGETD